jgi:hypothetical protein
MKWVANKATVPCHELAIATQQGNCAELIAIADFCQKTFRQSAYAKWQSENDGAPSEKNHDHTRPRQALKPGARAGFTIEAWGVRDRGRCGSVASADSRDSQPEAIGRFARFAT